MTSDPPKTSKTISPAEMRIGDFAMLSFFRENKEKELYTFDDLDSKTAWFYEKIKK